MQTRQLIPSLCAAASAGLATLLVAPGAFAADMMVWSLADSGPGSLRQAVLDANSQPGPDTIGFADGLTGTIGLTTGQLNITGPVTIEGPGADRLAVSGNHQSRVFRISGGATVVIGGLTITRGRATGAPGEGGGILNSGSSLTLLQVVLSDNQAVGAPGADGRGGAVGNLPGATLSVADCLFSGNQALGGARGRGNSAGILNLSGRLTVRRSTFLANQALGGAGGGPALGGGISNVFGATATVTDSTFLDNQSIGGDGSGGIGAGRGGGIYNFSSTITVENSTFHGNMARGGSGNTGSGSVVASAFGGAFFSGDAATLFLTGCILKGNEAVGGSGNTSNGGNGFVGAAFGGGLINIGTATVTDCLFEDNEARGGSGNRGDGASVQFVGTGTGGGIHASAGDPTGHLVSMTLHNVTIRHNRAVGGDGNAAGTFVNAGSGGGLGSNGSNNNFPVSSGSTITLRDSIVAHNQAVGGIGGDGQGGGVANILGGILTVTGSTLTHNKAQGGDQSGDSGLGGAFYNGAASIHPSNLGTPTTLTLEQSTVTFNAAQGDVSGAGGGLWNGGAASVLNTHISGNRALGGSGRSGWGGGAFNHTAGWLRLEGSSLSRNHANGSGGGVYDLGQLICDSVTAIFKNHASRSHDDLFGQID